MAPHKRIYYKGVKGGKMPSTNKLASARVKSRNRLAKFLLSFCGIASFGVFTILVALAATFSVSILSNNSVSALSTVSNQVSVTIPGSIALRLLDSTATAEIDSLSFDLTPVASGTALTKRTIVDVATSNPTGYKLYMQSNYQKSGSYTTDLVHTDSSVSDSIPTSTSASTLYWNYNNPLTSTTNPIPAHGTPDKIGQRLDAPTNSDQIPIDINVSVDTSIVSGTYENQLLFSAVGNPSPVAYTVSFNADGGSPEPEDISETARSGTFSTTIPSTIPTKVGYTFDHWEISVVSSGGNNGSGGITTNEAAANCNNTNSCTPGDTLVISSLGESTVAVELTAIYTINSHTVTIISNTGIASTTGSGTYDYDSTISISATPATGYTFTSWTVNSGSITITNNQFTMPDEDVTITANAVKKYTYTLNLNSNDGTTAKTVLNYPTSGGTTDTSHTFTNLNSQAPSRTGYTFLGWATTSTGTSYVTSYTLDSSSAGSTPTSSGFPVTGNLYAKWQLNSYTVSVTNSNTTSGASSLSIPYGGSKTVTVTPSSGYYLSGVSCPSGYTCSGYSTGYTKTGTQTVTVKNNNHVGGGTLTFTGTRLTLSQTCANTGSGGVFTYSGVQYRKLANGACYTRYAVATGTWSDSLFAKCPSGTRVPTEADFQSVINTYGTGSALNNATGWANALYWAYTLESFELSKVLQVETNYAAVGHWFTSASLPLICIVK